MRTLATSTPSRSISNQVIIVLIISLINPTIGLLFGLLMAISAPNDYRYNRPELISFLVISAVWISLINITKSITGDQVIYTRIFLNVPEEGFVGTVVNAWGGTGKEPVFSFLTWLLYYITGGSVRIYYFTLSFVMYILQYMATYRLLKKMNVPKGALICGVLILTFFTQYFVMTLQIVRQLLAGSVVIYALVDKAISGKNNWKLLVLAVLIHTSAIFIAALSLVPWFYKWMNIKRIAIVLGSFTPMIVFNTVIGNMFGGSSGVEIIDYGLSSYSGENPTGDTAGTMSISIMLMIFVPLTISCIKILVQGSQFQNDMNKSNGRMAILPIVYICILLMIFVLSFTKVPLVQYRFFYYSYCFLPLILPLLVTKSPGSNLYWGASSLFFIVRFFVTHNTSGWTYASVPDILSSTMYFFWTGNFHPLYLQ